MNDAPSTPALHTESILLRRNDTAAGVSVLLTALAFGFALLTNRIIFNHHTELRGRAEMDSLESFVDRMHLAGEISPYMNASTFCLIFSALLCIGWVRRAGWAMRIGFASQWLIAFVFLAMVFISRRPD